MRLCALRFPRQLKEVSSLSWAVDACTKRHLNCEMMRRNFSLPLYLRAALMFAACALLIPYVPAPARAAQTISGATPTTIADRAIAARLFGVHPYARFVVGTPESLARVERNDLLLARDRFITADNARLVMIGGVEPARAMRAFRQFLGAWRKSEALVPATFRQPPT